jgi:hypothetical protein
LRRDLEDEIRILSEQRDERIYELFEGRKLTKDLTDGNGLNIKKGETLTRELLKDVDTKILRKAEVAPERLTLPEKSKNTNSARRAR